MAHYPLAVAILTLNEKFEWLRKNHQILIRPIIENESEEVISTGIDEIDEQIRDSYKRTEIILNTGSGTYVNDEIVYQSPNNLANATAQAKVYSWHANTKKLEIYLTQGEFANTSNVIGNTSGAIWTSNTVDDFANDNTAFEDIVDNKRIQDEADLILDFTEKNPFGIP